MGPRANWKGYLKLSLVSCPVQLFPATSTRERVAFHLLNRDTGNRLKRRLIDPDTDETVDADDQVKGYQVGKNEYVLVEEDEIEAVAIESSHTIDIETFVPRAEIDGTFVDTPYYLAPDGAMAAEAFAVIRDAMLARKVVGIGRVVLYRRERAIMLEPRGKGLVATTLRYGYEVRSDEDYFEDIGEPPVSEEMLDLAAHIIDRKLAHFDPKRFEDRYQNALLELIKAKQHDQPVKPAKAPAPTGNVVSLMDALRKSIAADKTADVPGPSAKAPSSTKARGSAESEGGAKTSAKPVKTAAAGKASASSKAAPAASAERRKPASARGAAKLKRAS